MSSRSFPRIATATLSLTLVAGVAATLPAAAATPPTFVAAGGSGYASSVAVGSVAKSGKTAYQTMCTTSSTYNQTNDTAKLDLGLTLGYIGAASTTTTSTSPSAARTATVSTDTAATRLLTGLISADTITSGATVKKGSSSYVKTGGSVFVGLKIAGLPITAKPAPNTTISIPGVATVLLNGQSTLTQYGDTRLNVTAMKVTLLSGNTLGLPAGTIVIGSSTATLHNPTYNRAYGSAYGTQIDVGGVVKSGPTAAVNLPCGGTAGSTMVNNLVSVSVPGVLSVGTLVDKGTSTDTSTQTAVVTQSTTGAVNVLDGVITADAITTKASAARTSSGLTLGSTGTQLVNLKINGKLVTATVEENTGIDIAGVGTLTLRKTVRNSSSIQVYALQLKLNTATAGLLSGTTITVGAAKAGVIAR